MFLHTELTGAAERETRLAGEEVLEGVTWDNTLDGTEARLRPTFCPPSSYISQAPGEASEALAHVQLCPRTQLI